MTQYSFNSALQTSDYTNLRGTGLALPSYSGDQLCSMLPNTVVFAAQFNTSTSGGSFVQEEYHNVISGSYTDVLPGQLFLASATNDMTKAYFRGRVRDYFNTHQAFFNETSISQTYNDYFWVIDDYPIMDKLLRFLADQPAGTPSYRADYNIVYRPMQPIVGSANDGIGLKGAYAGFVNSSNKFRISISALFYPIESAATITSWTVSIIDGTLVSGSLTGSGTTTGTITIDFPPGFRHVLVSCTNSASQTSTCAIKVWAETRTGSATLVTGFEGSTITLDASTQNGTSSALQSCTIKTFTPEFQNTLNNTVVCIWDEEILNNSTATGSIGGNVRFVGRLRKEDNENKSDKVYDHILNNTFTLEGPDTQLNRLNAKNMLINMRSTVTPSDWGDIKSMTLYRAVALLLTEWCTLTASTVVNFDVFDDTFIYPQLNDTGSAPLGIINDLLMSINGVMQFSPDGRALIARHAFYQSNSNRSGLTTVGNWTSVDYVDSQLQFDDIYTTPQVDAWGGVSIGGTQVTPLHSEAPGIAPDVGESVLPLLKQILANVGPAAAQTELNDRAGCHWQKEGKQRRLPVLHPDSYGGLIPDVSAWFTWTLGIDTNLRNISYDTGTRWILEKLSCTHSNKEGAKNVNATYLQETNGIGMGNTIAIVTANSLPADSQNLALGTFTLTQPVVPPVDFPGPDAAQLKSGIRKLGLILTDGKIVKTSNFQQSPPTWDGGTSLGVSGGVLRPVPDFFSGRYAGLSSIAYWWIITQTGEYYGDVTTPSFTLGHTFRSSINLRSAFASLKAAGHIVQSGDYGDGIWTDYGTSGTLGSETQLNATPGTRPPGVFTTIDGTVYTSINGQIYKSTDNGVTWVSVSGTSTGADTAASIASSLSGKYLYYGKIGSSFTNNYDFTAGQQGWVSSTVDISGCGVTTTPYVPGTGWGYFACNPGPAPGIYAGADFNVATPLAVTGISVTCVVGGTINPSGSVVNILVDGVQVATQSISGAGTFTCTYSGSITVNSKITIRSGITNNMGGTGTVYLTAASISNSSAGVPSLQRFDGTSSIDVSPASGFGPWLENQISVLPTNPLVLVVGAGNSGQTITGIWSSVNGGVSWIALVAPSGSNPYWAGWLAGDGSVVYLIGSGSIATININGSGLSDKTGNLSDNARIVGLAGL